jgi:hypothetical protein
MVENKGYLIPMMTYFKIGAVIFLIGFGFWIKHIWTQNIELREENIQMTLQIKKHAENVKLLVQQLDREIQYRENAEDALNQLNEVPDVIYSQQLSPEIQKVIDHFHSRIGK